MGPVPPDADDRAWADGRIIKGEEFLRAALDAHERQHWNATCSNAILAGIAAVDVYLILVHDVRSGGDHMEAVRALRRHGGPDVAEKASQLERLIRIKTKVQYGDRMFTAREAHEAVERAERLIRWAKEARREIL